MVIIGDKIWKGSIHLKLNSYCGNLGNYNTMCLFYVKNIKFYVTFVQNEYFDGEKL